MTKALVMVPETNSSVTRPVIYSVVRELMAITGIDEKTNIFYPTELEKNSQSGSLINDKSDLSFGANDKIIIDVKEEYTEFNILSTAVHRPEQQFIFLDKELDVYIKPVYSKTNVIISFRYRTKDKVAANRWRDGIRTNISMSHVVNLHTLNYHYLIPLEHLYILKEIHRNREAQAGYGDSYDKYFKEHVSTRATILTNLSGTKDAWAIAETQQEVQGWFDFEVAPDDGEREGETDAWILSFTYNFSYDKPIACDMQYPIIVHNQVLSKKYRQVSRAYEPEHQQRSYGLSTWFMSHFQSTRIIDYKNLTGVAIPDIDDFVPGNILPSTLRIFTALVALDPSNKKKLFNIGALGKYKLIDEILEFFKSEIPYMTTPYESIFFLNLYRNGNIVPSRYLKVNSNLDVSSTEDLNLRDTYRLRLGLVYDLSLLSKSALERLKKNHLIFDILLYVIDPSLQDKRIIPVGYPVTRRKIDEVIAYLSNNNNKQIRQFNTVMTLYVQSNRGS